MRPTYRRSGQLARERASIGRGRRIRIRAGSTPSIASIAREYNNAIRDLFALDRRREVAAARRRDRRRQLRQLRRRPLDLDRAPRTLPVGRAPGDAARDGPASGELRARRRSRFRCTWCRTTGRAKTCRSARAAASRFATHFPVDGEYLDQGSSAAAVSGLHHGHGLAAAARRPPRWQAAEALHRRRRRARAGPPRPATPATASRALPAHPEWEKYMQIDRRRRARGPRAGRGGPARRRRVVRAGAVGAGRPAATAAARPGPDERSGLHGLRERRLGPDRRPVSGSAGPAKDTPSRRAIFVCEPAASAGRARLRHEDSFEDRPAGLSPAGDDQPMSRRCSSSSSAAAATAEASTPASSSRSNGCSSIPDFLLRVHRDPRQVRPATASARPAYRLSDLEVASRLSFFLWSSIPDERLLDLAERGQLTKPAGPRAGGAADAGRSARAVDALVDDFAAQWLNLRRVDEVVVHPDVYPNFDDSLLRGVQAGNGAVRRQHAARGSQRPGSAARGLHVRQRAAGAPLRDSGHLRQPLPPRHAAEPRSARRPARARRAAGDDVVSGSHVAGAARQMAARTTSSACRFRRRRRASIRTSPETKPGAVPPTIRERLAQHRQDPVCSSCHSVIDPPGFALENFDAIGGWRTVDESGKPVDASGDHGRAARRSRGLPACGRCCSKQPEQFPAHGHRKAAGVRARPPARVLRSAGGAQDRPRRGGQRLPLVVAHSGDCQESDVSDAGGPASTN